MSDLSSVRAGLAKNLSTIDGLRVYPQAPDAPAVPAAIVLPTSVEYDLTLDADSSRILVDVLVLAQKAESRSSGDALDAYVAPSGPRSIRYALGGDPTLDGAACDLRVTGVADIGAIEWGDGHRYAACRVQVEVWV